MPPFPFAIEYLWDFFQIFMGGLVTRGMGGAARATWPEVNAFSQAMRLDLAPWEKETLIRLAALRANVFDEAQAQRLEDERRRRKG